MSKPFVNVGNDMQFSKQQLKFFDHAAKIAMDSKFDVYHLGCVAVLKNRIIASSPNKLKTHPLQKMYDSYREFNCRSELKNMHSLHAEIACLNSLRYQNINYKDIELYIVRIRRDGNFGLARPCVACSQYIKNLGIHKIFYSTNHGYAYEEWI